MGTTDERPRQSKKRRVQIAEDNEEPRQQPEPRQRPQSEKRRVQIAEDNEEPQQQSETRKPPQSKKRRVQITDDKKKPDRQPSSQPPSHSFKIISGSYEKILYGLSASVTSSPDAPRVTLSPIFIFPAHVSCIKAVAASVGGKWLATGSADEIVKVWDLKRRKEIGGLVHHQGSITHLAFPSRSHLLSASEDGTISLFHTRDWAVLRSLKGHKGRINCAAVHPSGKVALSVGKDRTLRMWDLMRGKGSASMKLGKEGELARWSPSGTLFAVQAHDTIDLFSTKMELLHTIKHPSRIHDIKFYRRHSMDEQQDSKVLPEYLLVAAEDKKVSIYELLASESSLPPPKIVVELVGHTNRVRAVEAITLSVGLPPLVMACTISSDGFIRVYALDLGPDRDQDGPSPKTIEPVAQYDTNGSRLTCLAVAEEGGDDDVAVGEKRKREAVEGTDAESEAESNDDDS